MDLINHDKEDNKMISTLGIFWFIIDPIKDFLCLIGALILLIPLAILIVILGVGFAYIMEFLIYMFW